MPTFLATRSALILEEITMGSDESPLLAFITHIGNLRNSKSYADGCSSQATDGDQSCGTSTNSTSTRSNGNNRHCTTNHSNGGGGSSHGGGGRNTGPSNS